MTVDARQFDEAQLRIAALTVNLTKVFPPTAVVGFAIGLGLAWAVRFWG